MKHFLTLLLFAFTAQHLTAQNTFPATGNVGIGTLSPGTLLDVGSAVKVGLGLPNSAILGLQSKTTTSISSGFSVGSYIYSQQSAALSGNIQALSTTAQTTHPSGDVTLSIGVSSTNEHFGAGTLASQRGVQANCVATNAGTITNSIAFMGNIAISGTGSITNGYGFYMNNFPAGVANKYGIYITDATARNYFAGSIGIGTTNPGSFKLAVEGKIGAREVKVTLQNPWPDYVFSSQYQLPDLLSVEQFIRTHRHLPGIPAAASIQKEGGIELGEMNRKLLEKIEELTLYLIELKKENQVIRQELNALQKK
jgi:hypothetical protein